MPNKSILKIIILSFPLIFICACTQNATTKIETTSGAQLLFFLNPDGNPCKMQDQILKSVESKISSKVSIKKISTLNPQDRPYFYMYGIRALPLLILIDSKGNVVERFSPGIHDKNNILNIISKCHC